MENLRVCDSSYCEVIVQDAMPENIVLSRIDYIVYIQAECACCCCCCRAGPQKNEQSNLVRQSWRELSLVVACLVGELPN